MLPAYQCLADPSSADRIDDIFNNINCVTLVAKENQLDWLWQKCGSLPRISFGDDCILCHGTHCGRISM